MTHMHDDQTRAPAGLKFVDATGLWASPAVEREIIARIVSQTGPGSLQDDIHAPVRCESEADSSLRRHLNLSTRRLRLRR